MVLIRIWNNLLGRKKRLTLGCTLLAFSLLVGSGVSLAGHETDESVRPQYDGQTALEELSADFATRAAAVSSFVEANAERVVPSGSKPVDPSSKKEAFLLSTECMGLAGGKVIKGSDEDVTDYSVEYPVAKGLEDRDKYVAAQRELFRQCRTAFEVPVMQAEVDRSRAAHEEQVMNAVRGCADELDITLDSGIKDSRDLHRLDPDNDRRILDCVMQG